MNMISPRTMTMDDHALAIDTPRKALAIDKHWP